MVFNSSQNAPSYYILYELVYLIYSVILRTSILATLTLSTLKFFGIVGNTETVGTGMINEGIRTKINIVKSANCYIHSLAYIHTYT